MPTLPQDGEFGTYGERKPRIVKKSMKVGEQDVGIEGDALAKVLDDAAKVSSAEVAAGEDPPADPAGPATDPAPTASVEEPAATVEPAQPEVEAAPEAQVTDQPAGEEPPQPAADEPVTPATEPGATEESVTLTRAEYDALKRGNLMQADYTRKTQAAAELRKETEALQAQARAERDQYLSLIKQVEDLLGAADQEPDWGELGRTLTPEEYAAARQKHSRLQIDRKSAQQERERVQQQQTADIQAQRTKVVEDEREKLFTVMPDLRDPKVLTPWLKRMHATAKSLGFSDEDFNGVADHRLFLVLNAAAKGVTVSTAKPKTTKPPVARPRSVGPGATPKTTAPQGIRDKAMAKLQKDKSVEAAGEYFATRDI